MYLSHFQLMRFCVFLVALLPYIIEGRGFDSATSALARNLIHNTRRWWFEAVRAETVDIADSALLVITRSSLVAVDLEKSLTEQAGQARAVANQAKIRGLYYEADVLGAAAVLAEDAARLCIDRNSPPLVYTKISTRTKFWIWFSGVYPIALPIIILLLGLILCCVIGRRRRRNTVHKSSTPRKLVDVTV